MKVAFWFQRKQREVAKENEFYYELLVQSLPSEQQEAYHLRNSASQVSFLKLASELWLFRDNPSGGFGLINIKMLSYFPCIHILLL